MKRIFIETNKFKKDWKQLGLSDEDLTRLKTIILEKPKIGVVMKETGGLRKMRFAFKNQGKSGSTRICYVDFEIKETIYLITAYAKKDKDNLTKAEKNNVKKMIENIEKTL